MRKLTQEQAERDLGKVRASAYARRHYERKIKPHSEKREQMRQRSRDYIRRRREEERRGTKQQLAQEMAKPMSFTLTM